MEAWLTKNVQEKLIPAIADFIKIPNQSPDYDPDWNTNGLQEKACHFAMDFAEDLEIEGYSVQYVKEPERTGALLAIIEPWSPDGNITEDQNKTVLLYGHLDKQPPLEGLWSKGLGPWNPVIKDGKLYGRGGADDGYAWFSCALLVKALQANKHAHNRIVLFFECCEESGSKDLLFYLQKYKSVIQSPSLIFCLDSGTTDYDHMCLTTTLRGVLSFDLKVQVLKQGQHSGMSSGIVPSPNRILRKILNDFENADTGELPKDLYVDIPSDKYAQASELIDLMGGNIDFKFPYINDNIQTMGKTGFENYMNRIWRPQMVITGIEGTPDCEHAGNVLVPWMKIKCSIRLPPSLNIESAKKTVVDYFNNIKVPYNAELTLSELEGGSGFVCPAYRKEVEDVLRKSAMEAFDKPVLFYGEGGSIPFLESFKTTFPDAQFVVTGVCGPASNIHAPDEMLELTYLDKLVKSIAYILRDSPGKL